MAETPVIQAAIKRLEARGVSEIVVVPLLTSEGGIEEELESDLKGLRFVFAKPLAPHPNLARWVEKQAR